MRLPAEQRRSQLLEVATELFAAHGFHATSMDDLAEAAGVTKPVLYQHFPSKRALYLELLADVDRKLTSRLVDGDGARVHRARAGPGVDSPRTSASWPKPRRVPPALRAVGAERPGVHRGGRGDDRPRRRPHRRPHRDRRPTRAPTHPCARDRRHGRGDEPARHERRRRGRPRPSGRDGWRKWHGSDSVVSGPDNRLPSNGTDPCRPSDRSSRPTSRSTTRSPTRSRRCPVGSVLDREGVRDGVRTRRVAAARVRDRQVRQPGVMDAYAGRLAGRRAMDGAISRELGADPGTTAVGPDHL